MSLKWVIPCGIGIFLCGIYLFSQDEPQPTTEEKTVTSEGNTFFNEPGIIFSEDGKWQGSDLLINLSDDIGIYTEIVTSGEDTLKLKQEDISNLIKEKFRKAGLKTRDPFLGGAQPHPYLHFLIYVHPIDDKGYITYCQARLFESVKLNRLPPLEKGAVFQAITWEKDSLLIAPQDSAIFLIEKTLGNVADEFIERYRYFEQLKEPEKKPNPPPLMQPIKPVIKKEKKPPQTQTIDKKGQQPQSHDIKVPQIQTPQIK